MSFINIINESFDKQNKNILAGSKGKKLDEAAFTDNFNGHSDELDRFYDYMFEAAKDLGFQDFDVVDDGWTVTLTYIDTVGNKQQAEFDFDDELSFESKEDAIDCLVSLDWKVVDDEDEDLDEDLDTRSKNDLDFNDFLNLADIILVDDAQTFDINQWEASIKEELESDEADNDSSTTTTSKVNFVKYELDNDKVKQIIDKIKTSDINIADYWKTKRFLKKNNLSKSDLDSIIKGIEDTDYKYNSAPTPADSDKSEAVIFVKKSKINDLGPFKLYIKLDYDSIENTPIIVISIHPVGK